jgi:hypothetical protein
VLVCGAAKREKNLPFKGTSLSLSRHVEGSYSEKRGGADLAFNSLNVGGGD